MSARPEFDEVLGSDAHVGTADEPTGSRLDDWWERLSPRTQRVLRWAAPALVVAIAAFTRLWNLGSPRALVFDETFYVKDAWTLWNLGYEASWPAEADALFVGGHTDAYSTAASFVVHPPLGKWLIGMGMAAFGPDNPVGWRISTALAGILAVVLVMLIARYLFKSTLLATIAGLLMAIEGNAIVMSRVGLLDNFVMLFALLGFGAILLDRQWSSVRLAAWLGRRRDAGLGTDWGPALWWRPWLIAAGAAFGAAAAVKWNGLYFLAFFAIYTLVVDAIARRRSGIPFWATGTVFKQAPVTFVLMVPVAVAVYLVSWTGWFVTDGGYSRHWADGANAWTGLFAWVPAELQSFLHFEKSVYDYHVGENRPHAYQANPLTWLLLVRPTSMWYESSSLGQNGCEATTCGASITGIANPIIWWAATAAMIYLVYRLVRYREWPVGLILAGLAAGYLPWLLYLNRTVFQFYTIAFEPYLILALTLVIGLVLGSPRNPWWERTSGVRVVVVFLAVAIAASVFFWPLWTGMQLDYDYMRVHWWLPTWR
ncbi:MAG: phospholipid carrier-dependent glycosyltransferase [Rhodoglobus sp.]|nr:phospholipid carrier-dependent glycosyltransferase [Rhodoglobus sp.]